MVKKKEIKTQKNITFLDLSKTLFKNYVFSKNLPIKIIGGFAIIQTITLIIIAILSNHVENYSKLSDFNLILGILLIEFLGLIGFSFFYVFLNAFGEKRKPYLKSFLVSLILTLNIVIVGNILNLIGKYSFNETIITITTYLFLILFIYYLIYFNLSFKNYYGINIFKVVASFILTFMTFLFIIVFLESFKALYGG